MKFYQARSMRDFHRGTRLNNPFFTERKKSILGKIIGALLAIMVLSGLVYGLFYSPLWRISDIEIAGASTVPANELKDISSGFTIGYSSLVVPKNSYFFVDTASIHDALMDKFKIIRTLDIKKSRQKLTISVEERKPTFRLIEPNSVFFFLDQDGGVMGQAQPGEGENLIALMRADTTVAFDSSVTFMSTSKANFLLNLNKYFATLTGVRDKMFVIDPKDDSVKVVTREDWDVIFDPSISLDDQLNNLKSVLVAKFGPNERKNISYIDVRFGDRIFYKFK